MDSSTTVVFDAKPVSRSVRSNCGDNCSEHPANIQLTIKDNNGAEYKLRYSINYNGATRDYETGNYKQISQSVEQNEWTRNITFKVQEQYPDALKIENIYLFGAGWDFDGEMDNIRISSDSSCTAATTDYTQTDIDNAIAQGKQVCMNSPSVCGISTSGSSVEAGTVSANLDIYVPSLNYTTLLGTQNIWLNLNFSHEDSGKFYWTLKDYGSN